MAVEKDIEFYEHAVHELRWTLWEAIQKLEGLKRFAEAEYKEQREVKDKYDVIYYLGAVHVLAEELAKLADELKWKKELHEKLL